MGVGEEDERGKVAVLGDLLDDGEGLQELGDGDLAPPLVGEQSEEALLGLLGEVEQLGEDLLEPSEGDGLVLQAGDLGPEGLLLPLAPLVVDLLDAEVGLDILPAWGGAYMGWCLSLLGRSGWLEALGLLTQLPIRIRL